MPVVLVVTVLVSQSFTLTTQLEYRAAAAECEHKLKSPTNLYSVTQIFSTRSLRFLIQRSPRSY